MGQVQYLLIHSRSTHGILSLEIRERDSSQLIISLSLDEPHHKIRLTETEHTVVVNPVLTFRRIFITNGRMTEQSIDFRARGTGKQADTDTIQRGCTNRCNPCYQYKQKNQFLHTNKYKNKQKDSAFWHKSTSKMGLIQHNLSNLLSFLFFFSVTLQTQSKKTE